MNSMEQVLYVVEPQDNVATALCDIQPGAARLRGGQSGDIDVLDPIPFGHKVALRAIARGEAVVKYAYRIATASQNIDPGRYVHTHNAKSMQDTRSNAFDKAGGGAVTADREYTLC